MNGHKAWSQSKEKLAGRGMETPSEDGTGLGPVEERSKLKIHYAPADEGGTSFHWCRLPAKLINDSNIAEAVVNRYFDLESDVLVIQRQINPAIIPSIKHYQEEHGAVIYWLEDQVFLLPITSPVRTQYDNKAQAGIEKIVKECDGVTVSSQPLADYLSRFNENVYVLPHIMMKKWATKFKPKTERNDGKIRILWTTTAHHKHDFPIIEHALKDVTQKYPNVTVVLWGFITPRIRDMIPKDQLEFYGWVPIDHYYECLASMEADIGICPLEIDSIYNQAKTNLKWLEYSLMGCASVVTDCLPYSSVEDGETGLKIHKNKHTKWVNALCTLVEDTELRNQLATNAHQYVMENHTEERIKDYIKIYEEIYGKRQKEAPQGTQEDKS